MLTRLKRYFSIRILGNPDIRNPREDDVELYKPCDVIVDWPREKKKPFVGLTRDTNENPHWTKYRRFLKNNGFDFEIFEYHRSDWLEAAKNFDLIIWSPNSGPAELDEIKRKIYILEKKLGKKCFPDYETLLLCDDKVMSTYFLKMNGLPVADTFISNDYHEIEQMKTKFLFPLVSKRFHGASSREVDLIKNPAQLSRFSRRAFSFYGKKCSNAYFRQKNYVYLQRLVNGDGLDVRVNVAGNVVTGYFRKPKRNDFRASGSGIVIKEDLPLEAVEIALKTYGLIGKAMLGVDMMRDREGKFWIIEISPFIGVITPIQMKVDNVPGCYFLLEDGTLEFKKDNYWPQELAMKNFLERNYLLPEAEWKSNFVLSVVSEKKLKRNFKG
ncbi:RimK-like protein [Mesotoga prima MesG1.Ag.4.2]|uniref:RimK-like protein n=1 Tax=Mesotoga prima MesG1.Ag.4.2 TaxID=660470 RepID=I2F4M0_9BACT|nr:RimK-like protein [Mesotoga prima]AFK06873.1 RimK-like protein [Mesotoga prima MesG1.Ag.4.2]